MTPRRPLGRLARFAPVALVTTVATVLVPLSAGVAFAAVPTSCKATMGGTFLQPSFPVFAWNGPRYDLELGQMQAVGMRTVIDQWTVDMDAGEAYYPAPDGFYRRGKDMVDDLLYRAGGRGMDVWLGLGNVSDWQSHATDAAWLANQLAVDKQIADQLWALYPGRIKGWYISNEVDDVLLSSPAAVGPMTTFFASLADYLHTHDGNLKVMTSPTYSGLHLSTTHFAQKAKQVMGAVDVLNVQDGGGSGYIGPSDITNWFSALSTTLAGTRTALWSDADMFASPSGPMPPSQLQEDLKATCGLAAARTGFSFTTQIGPTSIGTSTYYDAYKRWVGARR